MNERLPVQCVVVDDLRDQFKPESQVTDGFYFSTRGPFGGTFRFGTRFVTNGWDAPLFAGGARWRAIAKARGYSRKQIREAARQRLGMRRAIRFMLSAPPWPSAFAPLFEDPKLKSPMYMASAQAFKAFDASLPKGEGGPALPWASGVSVAADADGLHITEDVAGYGTFVATFTAEGESQLRINGHPKEVWDAGVCVVAGCDKRFDANASLPFCAEHTKGIIG
jgi:hypothetical protein